MAVHFVGFRGTEVLSAYRIWGKPDFWHIHWDKRAQAEVAEGDLAIFACSEEPDHVHENTYDDSSFH